MSTMTDLFCGAGGSSTGADEVPGIEVKLAANHWQLAIDTHAANHPHTDHDCADLSQVEPRRYHRTDILWASPECTNHSVAKGIARAKRAENQQAALWEEPLPADAAVRSRATMWDVPRFAEVHDYSIVITENVVDAAKWVMFPAWLQAMELLGYQHHIVWLNSMHAQLGGWPAPQSRDRMYVVFWKGVRRPNFDRLRPDAVCAEHGLVKAVQVFKKAQPWGRYRAQYTYRCPKCGHDVEPPWVPASEVIDWSNVGTRIGDRVKPLSAKTMARIQAGIDRYWGPLAVPVEGRDGKRAQPLAGPFRTQSTRLETGIVVPLRNHNTVKGASDPLDTIAANGNHHGLLMRNNTARGNQAQMTTPVTEPMRTITTAGHQSLLMPYYGNGTAAPTSDPHRTLTTGDRYALVEGEAPSIEDCMFRMLTPKEVKLGMAFPDDYQMLGNKREQVKMAGNAVTPPAARGLLTIANEALEAA